MELRNGIICSCCLISPQKAVCIVALKFSKEQFQPSCSGGETLCITFLRKRKLGIIYLLSTPVIAAPYFYLLIRQRRFNRNFYMNERKMQLCNGIRNRRNVYVNIIGNPLLRNIWLATKHTEAGNMDSIIYTVSKRVGEKLGHTVEEAELWSDFETGLCRFILICFKIQAWSI